MIGDSELDLGKLFVNDLVDRGTGWKVIGGWGGGSLLG